MNPTTFVISMGWSCSGCFWRGALTREIEASNKRLYKPEHYQTALQRLYELGLTEARLDQLLTVLDLMGRISAP